MVFLSKSDVNHPSRVVPASLGLQCINLFMLRWYSQPFNPSAKWWDFFSVFFGGAGGVGGHQTPQCFTRKKVKKIKYISTKLNCWNKCSANKVRLSFQYVIVRTVTWEQPTETVRILIYTYIFVPSACLLPHLPEIQGYRSYSLFSSSISGQSENTAAPSKWQKILPGWKSDFQWRNLWS